MRKPLWTTLLVCLAGHAYLGFFLGLSTDEAHYALYAAHPALSYFDHPPLAGWVQIPAVAAGGTDWMLRVMPLLFWSMTAYALWRFSVWALVLFLLSPLHQLLGLALIPDTLLLPLTLWVMWLTWNLTTKPATTSFWLGLGVALGLAGLSKYTGVFLALGTSIVLLHAHGKALLKNRNLWIAAAIAALIISPVFVWNAQHDWMSFTYQADHAGGGDNNWEAKRVLVYSLVQLLTYGTLPLVGLIIFIKKLRHTHAKLMRFCFAFGLPALALLIYLSGRGATLPHWTASHWLALFPLCALGLAHGWQSSLAARCVIGILGLLQVLSIVALALAMAMGGEVQGASRFPRGNPFADLHDWQAAAQQAQALQAQHHADALAVSNWTLASRLAWYARPAKVLALDGKNKQFDLWFGKPASGQSYLLLDWSQMPLTPLAHCQGIAGDAGSHHGEHSNFDFYVCKQP